MSRIGKKKLEVPSGVTLDIKPDVVSVKGPKGELKQTYIPRISLELVDGGKGLMVNQVEGAVETSAFQGLYRSLIKNMIEGVTTGYRKEMEVVGVGYKVQAQGDKLVMNIGYNKPVEYKMPAGIKVEAPTATEFVLSGIDKRLIGQVAAEIRSIRRPEPYKGKGVKYKNEVIRRKAGKAVGGK